MALLGLALLPLWSVLLPLLACAIRLEDGGPVLYRQTRLGRGGRTFTLLKFRTMVVGAERATGPVLARTGDARVTRVGRLLRRLHVDELPQVLNVLRGEMSLVGPRPERPDLAARLERQCPGFARRLAVSPGIAGLAQARRDYRLGARDKLRYDLLYIANLGPWLDLRLLAACTWRALRGPRPPRASGPFSTKPLRDRPAGARSKRPGRAPASHAGSGLDALRPRAEGPVTLVFGTADYAPTILEWIRHARAAGCRHFRIVCLDSDLPAVLQRHGARAHALAFRDLLPDAALPEFGALAPRERLRALTPLRVKAFARLAGSGCDFIHCDADAFWLADPRPWLAARPGVDLLCSQGTTHPRAHYHRHRFTLCAGFFLCRANDRTRDYFDRVDALAPEHPSDQVRMNEVLLRDRGARWRLDRPALAVRGRGAWFVPPGHGAWLPGARALQRHALLRAPANAALRLAGLDWIFTSRRLIRGRFTGGLSVGVLPMRVVMRGRFEGCDRPLVLHASANKRG